MRRVKRNSAAVVVAALMTSALGAVQSVEARPPPVEFALQAVGELANERGGEWSMTRVDDGIVALCAGEPGKKDNGDREGRVFSGDQHSVQVGPGSDMPWRLVWAVLWSSSPGNTLADHFEDWGEDTARIEVFDGAPVYCYGRTGRLCVDEKLRRIAVVEVPIDGVRWQLRSLREGDRLQVSADGSSVARFSADGC